MERVIAALREVSAERGQALGEYSLILAFVAMACVLALGALGLVIATQIDSVGASLL